MSNESLEVMDVGLAVDLKMAFRRNGFSIEEIKRACAGEFFGKVREVLRGFSEIRPIELLVDLDVDPFVPNSLTVEQHTKGGRFRFDPSKVKLHLADKQKTGVAVGHDLRKKIEPLNPFNASLLDWLLKPENQKFIPEKWKGKMVFFWGTIYRDRVGYLCVRYLYWYGDGWYSLWYWLDYGWDAFYPALVPASV